MNSIKTEDIIIPDFEALMNCIYNNFMSDIGQEFDYESYSKALDKIDQIASSSDYNELEDTITEGFQNSAKHGFLMGARMTMTLLFGWKPDPGSSAEELKVMEFMKGGDHNG